MKAKFVYKGGPGSGHYGHGGRPGKQGGSLPGNESQGGHDSPFTASEMSADARAMRRMTEELDRQRADEKKKRKAEGDLEEASRKRDAKGVLDAEHEMSQTEIVNDAKRGLRDLASRANEWSARDTIIKLANKYLGESYAALGGKEGQDRDWEDLVIHAWHH